MCKNDCEYSAEIKIVVFQSISEHPRDKWRSSSNYGWIAAKIAHFNSKNSEIIGRKFTKFVHDVEKFILFNLFNLIYGSNHNSLRLPIFAISPQKVLLFLDWNVTKIVHNVENFNFILFNLLKSELRYCNPLQNGSTTKKIALGKRQFLTLIGCHGNIPWEIEKVKRG